MGCLFYPMLRWVLAAVVVFGGAYAVQAQGVQLRLLEERADGVVYEMTASWPMSLRAALDSVNATALDEHAALAVSRGGLFELSERILRAIPQGRRFDLAGVRRAPYPFGTFPSSQSISAYSRNCYERRSSCLPASSSESLRLLGFFQAS